MNNNYKILREHSITKYIENKNDVNIYEFFSDWHRVLIKLAHSSCEFQLSVNLSETITKIYDTDTCIVKLSGAMVGAYDEIAFIMYYALKEFINNTEVLSHTTEPSYNSLIFFFHLPTIECNDRMSHLHGDYCVEFTFNGNDISSILLCEYQNLK